jgi:hypothetical protein
MYLHQWRRCDVRGAGCQDVGGADGETYTLGGADVGHTIRLLVRATGTFGTGTAESDPSALVAPASAPAPPPAGRKGPAPRPPKAPRPRRLSPFPRIVVAGMVVGSGTVVTEVSVRGPRGVSIAVSCRGRGCPFRRRSFRMRGRTLRIRALQRRYRGSTALEFRVTKRGAIGKYARIRLRRGGVPKRVDRCLYPGSSRPRRCPRT